MGWRGTLALVLTLLIASAWLYHEVAGEGAGLSWESVVGGPGQPPSEQVVHLLSFSPDEIIAVKLERDGRVWRTDRRADGWSGVTQPHAIDDFLGELLELAEIMPIDVPPKGLGDHGLAPPEGVIELLSRNRPPIILLLGSHNPPATGTYAQLGLGGRVVLTGALATWEFDKAIRALNPADGAS
jgi:hypothetical protein